MNRRNTRKPPRASTLLAVIERLESRAMLAGLGQDSLSGLGSITAVLLPGVSPPPGIIFNGGSPTLGSAAGTGGSRSNGPVLLGGSGSGTGSSSGGSSSSAPNGPVLLGGSGSGTSSSSGGSSSSDPNGPVLLGGSGSGTGSSSSGSSSSAPTGPVLSSQYTSRSNTGGQGRGTNNSGTHSGSDLWLLYGVGLGAASSSSGASGGSSPNFLPLLTQYTEGSNAGGQGNGTEGTLSNADLWNLYWSGSGAGSSSSGSDEGSLADDPTISAQYTGGSGIGCITPLVYNPQSDGPPVFHSGVWTGDEGGVQFVQTADTGSGQDGGDPPAGRPAWNNDDVEDYYHGPRWLFEFEAGVGRYDPPKEIPKPRDELAGVVPTDPDGKYQAGRKQELDTLPTKVGEKGKEFALFMANYIGPDEIGWAAKGLAGGSLVLGAIASGAGKADDAGDAAKAARGGIPTINKAINSDIVHAADRAVGRAVFPDAKSAADALRDLSKRITAAGLPSGTIPDPRRADSVLVPIGNGWAVYEIKDNGTAILRTVLGAN